ncbi:MAG: hypothetical protein R3E77_06630 [Steroidobacteraceae bacterium]
MKSIGSLALPTVALLLATNAIYANAADLPIKAQPNVRDGSHDFDFELGEWTIHLRRLMHPLTGSSEWVQFDGKSKTRRVWDGAAQIEEFNVGGPSGPIVGLTLRLYNPATRQWSLYWANQQQGAIGGPANVGQFSDGVGEFFAQDTYQGRTILIRYQWTQTDTEHPHFEQAFSDDGGKTWEVNWITDQVRLPTR